MSKQRILRRLYKDEEIVVGATDGKATIAKAKKVFTGNIDPEFNRLGTCDVCRATRATKVAIYEVKRDATLAQMFSSLGDLNALVWEQSQIVKFCKEYTNRLGQAGGSVSFLFKVDDKFFIADVRVCSRDLMVYAYHIDFFYVFGGDGTNRMVVPQPNS
jgi:hypothetical protein